MREMEKVFISGPISSRPKTYKADFSAAAELVERAGFIPINPALLPEGMSQGDYMKITFAMLEASDMVLLLDGWEFSDGANLEAGYAEYIKKPCLDLSHFISRYLPKLEPTPAPEPELEPEPASGQALEPQRLSEKKAVKGFIIFECGVCGHTREFFSRNMITENLCRKCGEVTPLDYAAMRPAYAKCKCGRECKYMTNATADLLSIRCVDCGAPVDLQINRKGNAYITLRD